MQETRLQSLRREDPLEEDVANRCSILTWRIPWTEEPGGLQSMRSQSQTRLSDKTTTASQNKLQIPPVGRIGPRAQHEKFFEWRKWGSSHLFQHSSTALNEQMIYKIVVELIFKSTIEDMYTSRVTKIPCIIY